LYLTDQLDDTTCFLDFALSLCGEVSGTDDEWDFWDATLSKNLGVTEREEVEYWSGVRLLVGQVLLALLDWNEGPELVQVDDWLPEVVALLVEVSHTNLSEVTWMVFIHVGSVVMLTTSETTTTGMLAVLADTSVTGGDVTAMLAGV